MGTRTTRIRQTNADLKSCAILLNDKLKSAFVRLIRVVRVSIHSLLFRFTPIYRFLIGT